MWLGKGRVDPGAGQHIRAIADAERSAARTQGRRTEHDVEAAGLLRRHFRPAGSRPREDEIIAVHGNPWDDEGKRRQVRYRDAPHHARTALDGAEIHRTIA